MMLYAARTLKFGGQILKQSASHKNINQLQTPADSKYRLVVLPRHAEHVLFQPVPLHTGRTAQAGLLLTV